MRARLKRANKAGEVDLLGEHQDSVVTARLLREIGAAAGIADGEDGLTFGLLHQREGKRAAAARKKARRTARRCGERPAAGAANTGPTGRDGPVNPRDEQRPGLLRAIAVRILKR